MTSKRRNEADKLIKKGLEELAAGVQVPDVPKAYERYKKYRAREARFQTMAVAVAVCLVTVLASTGPARAFRGFLRTTITRMISETSQLFQRADEEMVVDSADEQRKQYHSLETLREDGMVAGFVPEGLKDEWFDYAEILIEDRQIKRLSIDFRYQDTSFRLLYYIYKYRSTSGRTVDIEDFSAEHITFNDRELEIFTDDKGFTMIQWDVGKYLVELWGCLSVEELVEAGTDLGLF